MITKHAFGMVSIILGIVVLIIPHGWSEHPANKIVLALLFIGAGAISVRKEKDTIIYLVISLAGIIATFTAFQLTGGSKNSPISINPQYFSDISGTARPVGFNDFKKRYTFLKIMLKNNTEYSISSLDIKVSVKGSETVIRGFPISFTQLGDLISDKSLDSAVETLTKNPIPIQPLTEGCIYLPLGMFELPRDEDFTWSMVGARGYK